MTTQQRANLDSARALAARKIGWDGPTAAIPYALRETYATELANLIVSYPVRFDAQTVATARAELADRSNGALASYGLLEAVGDAAAEAARQAERVNPLSEQNATATRWTITGILAAAAITFAIVWGLRTAPGSSVSAR